MESHELILRALGNLEGKVDGINDRLDKVNGRLNKHDDQIAEVSKEQATASGKASVWGVISGAAVGVVASLFTKAVS